MSFSEYSKPVLVGVGATFVVLPMVIVGLRFFARRFTHVAVGIDDWVILFALVLSTAAGAVEIHSAVKGGMGQHQRLGPQGELVHTPELTIYEKCRYANLIITTLNLGVVKISILLFYRRLFPVKPFKIATACLMGLIGAWALAFTSAMAAQCSPPSYFWEAFEIDYPARCIQVQALYQGLAYSDLILDAWVLALPIPVVASLKLPWKSKIKVIDILLLGSVVLGSGIARLVAFMEAVNFTNDHPKTYFKDTLWFTAGPLFWVFAENAMAIIGACLPTLAPFWTNRSSSGSKKISYPDSTDRYASNEEDASIQDLVAGGPITRIHAEDIALEDRAHRGIRVHTALSSKHAQQSGY